jgi:hypothetical protein
LEHRSHARNAGEIRSHPCRLVGTLPNRFLQFS